MRFRSFTSRCTVNAGLVLLLLLACGPTAPVIKRFTATPASLPSGGGQVTLAWEVVGSGALSLGPNIGSVEGTSLVVNVTTGKTFTLTATQGDDTVTAQATVTVGGGVDTTRPTVLEVTPADGSTGVTAQTPITFTFSEPMQRSQAQGAYTSDSPGIRASEVAFEWNDEATVLTVRPKQPLAYGAGAGPITYSVRLAEGASDLAGNPLAPAAASFKTLRKLSLTVRGDPLQDGAVDGSEVDNGSLSMTVTTSSRGLLGFNLRDVPTGLAPERLTAATLRVNAQYPMVFNTERIEIEHVLYGPSLTASAATTQRLRNLGFLAQEPPVENAWKSADVLAAVRDDLAGRTARGERSQFRLRCTGCTVIFYAAEAAESSGDAALKAPQVVLEYLLP